MKKSKAGNKAVWRGNHSDITSLLMEKSALYSLTYKYKLLLWNKRNVTLPRHYLYQYIIISVCYIQVKMTPNKFDELWINGIWT